MAGYIGSKSSVTLVDGYNEAEADAEFVAKSTTGDLTLDVSGIVNLDSSFSSGTLGGIIRLSDAGTQFADLHEDSGNFLISSAQVDKDIIFKGNDGGSVITAMTIDMSAGGTVGIGTSSPTAKLNVAGATSGDYLAKIESTNQFGLKIKTTSTSDSHEQFAIHDGNNNAKFKVMGGGTVHATGINLGGSGAANRLDDYEEGTWTPTATNGGSFSNSAYGTYTKIGNVVTLHATLIVSSNSSGLGFGITSLPFAQSSSNTEAAAGFYMRYTTDSTYRMFYLSNGSVISVYSLGGGATTFGTASTKRYDFSGVYYTDA